MRDSINLVGRKLRNTLYILTLYLVNLNNINCHYSWKKVLRSQINLMPNHSKDQVLQRKRYCKSKKLSIYSTLMEEDPSTPNVLVLLVRTQSSHDFPWLRIQEPNHLSNDLRFGCGWVRTDRFLIIPRADDSEGIGQGHSWEHSKNIQLVRRRENRIHFNKKSKESG